MYAHHQQFRCSAYSAQNFLAEQHSLEMSVASVIANGRSALPNCSPISIARTSCISCFARLGPICVGKSSRGHTRYGVGQLAARFGVGARCQSCHGPPKL